MLSDTDATYVDIYWGCVKTKGKQSPLGRSMAVTKTTTTTTHTHTHTQILLDLMLSVPNNCHSLLCLDGPTFKTAALQSLQQTLTSRSSHRQSACIHYGTLFAQWKCFWRHEIFVFGMSTVDIAQ